MPSAIFGIQSLFIMQIVLPIVLALFFHSCDPEHRAVPSGTPTGSSPQSTCKLDMTRDEGATVYAGAKKRVRVLVIGDNGSQRRKDRQLEVARAMSAWLRAESQKPDAAITVGDNFYTGTQNDLAWQKYFLDPYGEMYDGQCLPYLPALGNHDYEHGRHHAELGYSSPGTAVRPATVVWNLPAPNHSFRVGPVEFFAWDTAGPGSDSTPRISETDESWLRTQMSKPKSTPWRVVYGHHPIASGGHHAQHARYFRTLGAYRTLVESRPDLYVAGHDHDLQVLSVDGILTANLGASGRAVRRSYPTEETRFCASAYGFGVIDASEDELTLRVFAVTGTRADPKAEQVFQCVTKKGEAPKCDAEVGAKSCSTARLR